MVIYSAKGEKIHPHNIPSFQFDPDDFRSMLVYITERCFGVVPSAPDLVLADETIRAPIKDNYDRGRQMRTLMSVIICISLVTYLGRKAVVNYSFNMGLKEYKQEHYEAAAEFYKRAAFFEPTFAPAWDQLARCEYRAYKHKEAEEHWLKALQMKPDYVESKIGLATLHMLRHDYPSARTLLKKAIQLSPTNVAAYMSLADLLIREHQYTSAIELLREVVGKDEANERARGLLARALLRSGNVPEALQVLKARDVSGSANNAFSDDAFMKLVGAEADIALGKLPEADATLNALKRAFGGGEIPDDLLLDFIALRKAQHDERGMNEFAEMAAKRGIPEDEVDAAKRISMLRAESKI
jgi:cytochrome c-type biogenesis protein CcmH/NrfG